MHGLRAPAGLGRNLPRWAPRAHHANAAPSGREAHGIRATSPSLRPHPRREPHAFRQALQLVHFGTHLCSSPGHRPFVRPPPRGMVASKGNRYQFRPRRGPRRGHSRDQAGAPPAVERAKTRHIFGPTPAGRPSFNTGSKPEDREVILAPRPRSARMSIIVGSCGSSRRHSLCVRWPPSVSRRQFWPRGHGVALRSVFVFPMSRRDALLAHHRRSFLCNATHCP